MSINISKQGVVKADGSNINPNLLTWGYSRKPSIWNGAGTTKMVQTEFSDFMRYTITTKGTDGGRYGYPCNGYTLVQGIVYTWSCEMRASTSFTGTSASRLGFEGGGMLTSDWIVGTEWTKITKTWTQTSSQAFVIYPSGALAEGEWLDIRNLKCELGTIATPYIAPSNESGYVGESHGFSEKQYVTPPVRLYNGTIESLEFIEI